MAELPDETMMTLDDENDAMQVQPSNGGLALTSDAMLDDVEGNSGAADRLDIMEADQEEPDETAILAHNLNRTLQLSQIYLRNPDESPNYIFMATQVVRELNFLSHRQFSSDGTGATVRDHLFNTLRHLSGVTIHTGNIAVTYPQVTGPLLAGMGASAVGGVGLSELPEILNTNLYTQMELLMGPEAAAALQIGTNGQGVRMLTRPDARLALLKKLGTQGVADFTERIVALMAQRKRAIDLLRGTFHPCLSQRQNKLGQVVSTFDLTTLDVYDRTDADGTPDGDVVVVPQPLLQVLCENCAAVLYRTEPKGRHVLGVVETAQRVPGDVLKMTWTFPRCTAMSTFVCTRTVVMAFEFRVLADLTLDGDLKIYVGGLPLLHRLRLFHVPGNKQVGMREDGTAEERLPAWRVIQHPTNTSEAAHGQLQAVCKLTDALRWLPAFVHVNFWDDVNLNDDREAAISALGDAGIMNM